MYGYGKDNGNIVGQIIKGDETVDLSLALESTSADEHLVCLNPSFIEHSENEEELKETFILSAKLNVNGDIGWYPCDNEKEISVMQRTISMSQMKSMLSDHNRNDVYDVAIKKCIDNFIEKEGRKPIVLDIGTGTGLLAMLACKNGAGHVIGCEMFDTMATIAQDVVNLNNFSEKITILPMKSTNVELDDPNMFPDILISELLDSALLGESCIYSHGDAISRLIRGLVQVGDSNEEKLIKCKNLPTSERVLPFEADVYGVLIESETIRNTHDVSKLPEYLSCNSTKWTQWRSENAKECVGGWPSIPVHWSELITRGSRELSSAQKVLNVNFTHPIPDCEEDRDDDSGFIGTTEENVPIFSFGEGCFDTDLIATCDGSVDGVMLWWKLFLLSPTLDPERKLFYSTEVGAMNWQDHWLQVVFPFPKPIICKNGDRIRVTVAHDSIHIWLKAFYLIENEESNDIKRPKLDLSHITNEVKNLVPSGFNNMEPDQCQCGWHMLCGPERIQMMNDSNLSSSWTKALEIMISRLASQISSEDDIAIAEMGGHILQPIVLDVSDGSLLSIAASTLWKDMLKNKNITKQKDLKFVSKESKQFSRMFFSQIIDANDLSNELLTWSGEDYSEIIDYFDDEIESNSEKSLDDNDIVIDEIDCDCNKKSLIISALISECFYYQLSSLPTWQALSFHYQRTHLSEMGLLAHDAIIMPSKAYIMAVAVELIDLNISHGLAGM